MKYPNAFAGIKKIFTAEILMVIAEVCTVIGVIAMIVALAGLKADSADAAVGGGAVAIIFMLGAGVLSIIAFILQALGLSKAALDEPNFKNGLWCVIAGLALTIVSSIMSTIGLSLSSSILELLSSIINMLIIIYVIAGIRSLSEKLEDSAMVGMGNKLLVIILIVYILSLISSLIVAIFGGISASVAAGVFALASAVLSAVATIIYIVYLGKAKKMLSEN